MRILFLPLLFILLCASAHAQNRSTDTSATCVAYWEKGDQKVFQVKHTKQKTEGGKVVSSNIISYEAHLKVLEAIQEGYTMEWSHKNYKANNGDAQTMMGVNTLMNGLKFKYTTDDVGSFLELLNWQEVRDFYIKMLELSLNKEKDEAAAVAFQTAKQMFQTKESVEGMMIKEIQLYHTPFGVEYDFRGQQMETVLPNFTGGEPFPATISLKLTTLTPSEDAASIYFSQAIDKGKASKQIAEIVKKMVPDSDKKNQIDDAVLSELELKDISQFNLNLSTGWLSKAEVKRTIKIGDRSNIETYEIVEKK